MHTPKAVALISGGLDSMLAAQLVQSQGVHVEGINFFTGFCVEGHTHALRRHHQSKSKRNNALWVAEQLGIKLHIIDVIEEYKSVLLNPEHGYGSHLNPCLDCKVFMIKKAKAWMEAHNFDFIITGEVMGQRPMSQMKKIMPVVANESEAADCLLRPLSAKLLPITRPEREGWVDREKLGDISGRRRQKQMSLARHLGIEDYAQPSGGCCFLANRHYAEKLLDLWQSRGIRAYDFDDAMLLKVGYHIRPASHYKLIIGREESENLFLEGYRKQFLHFRICDHAGPLSLVDAQATLSEADILQAAQVAAGFSAGRNEASVTVEVYPVADPAYTVTIAPIKKTVMPQDWYIEKRNQLSQKAITLKHCQPND